MKTRTFKKEELSVEVKSKQNFKAEWERAEFRAKVVITV